MGASPARSCNSGRSPISGAPSRSSTCRATPLAMSRRTCIPPVFGVDRVSSERLGGDHADTCEGGLQMPLMGANDAPASPPTTECASGRTSHALKGALAMVSPPLEASGMGATRESPGTHIDRDQRACGPTAQRLGLSAFHGHVHCCPCGMLLCTGPPGRSWAGQRFIGVHELLASP